MGLKILFISKNPVISQKFKRFIERWSPAKCDIITNIYSLNRLTPYDIRHYTKVVIHSERGDEFPKPQSINKLFKKYPKNTHYILYKYGPFYPSDVFTSHFSEVILRRLFTISP